MPRFALAVVFTALSLFAPGATPVIAHPGTGIVVDRQGRIYFTDLKQIWRIDPDGSLTVAAKKMHAHALAFDAEGNLVSEHDTPEAALAQAALVVIDGRGNRYFAEVNNHRRDISRIFRKTPHGEISLLAGGPWGHTDGKGAAARLGSIGGLTLGPDGFVYFTDSTSVRRASPDGDVATIARGGRALEAAPAYRLYGGLANHLMGLAVDARGTIYVANYGNRCLVEVSTDGRVKTLVRSQQPWSPTGVAVSAGSLFILEYGTALDRVRVRRVSPVGRVTTLGTVQGQER